MIYVASPYSHEDPKVMENRYNLVFRYCGKLMARGLRPFSPIVYGHQFHRAGLSPADYVWWKDFNNDILLICKEMHVLKIPGWHTSAGVEYEMKLAEKLKMPIKQVPYENI